MIEVACELARELPQYREAHDRDRRLAPAVIGALRERGVLGCLVPHLLGGAELRPSEYVQVLEALARGDSATAWVVMTATTTALLGAYLPRATADRLWASGTPLFAGIFAPSGKLVDGTLSGRWSFASGSRHADYVALGALADGKRHVMCFVPAASVKTADNWDTLGLAGTGSHDLVADNVRVAADHVCSVFADAPWPKTPLYRLPLFGVLASGVTACALGIAGAALDHAGRKLAGEREAPSAQLAKYAELHARFAAARAYLLATLDAAYAAAERDAVDGALRGAVRLAASHVAHECADVVRGAFHLGGGASMRTTSPMSAALRDIETLLTHKMVVDRVMPTIGRALLGIGETPPDL
ncbi:MAG TPA: acyl-CoA dehydrogenase family protein [Kofleriaceae bacterium]|nr:acyl-CoA dehydrogenase family protein [Kofleriaceae bacterium]